MRLCCSDHNVQRSERLTRSSSSSSSSTVITDEYDMWPDYCTFATHVCPLINLRDTRLEPRTAVSGEAKSSPLVGGVK